MTSMEEDLRERLAVIRAEGLYRTLRRVDAAEGPWVEIGGQRLLNFSSNDYLGFAREPVLKQAAREALERFGAGSGASRLVCGSMSSHHALEEALAAFKGTEAALSFASGYAAATGTLQALIGPGDVLVLDKRVHACVVDAARLCGAKLRIYAHNNMEDLEAKLRWADRVGLKTGSNPDRKPRVLVVTESVFSMDGDLARLRELVELKDRYGAWLMLDEAHATGLFGERRRGLSEAFELADRVEIHMGTLGKALGAAGGYICGPRWLIDFLINRARSFIFSTAPPPPVAAAATAAVQLVASEEGQWRRMRVWGLLDYLKNGLLRVLGRVPPVRSAIVPLVVGGEESAVALSERLQAAGFLIPAIRYPTVARGSARLRLTMTAVHEESQIDQLLAVLAGFKGTFTWED